MNVCSVARRTLAWGGLVLCLGSPAAAQDETWIAELEDGPAEIELEVSAGLSTDRDGGQETTRVTEDIASGIDLSNAIRRVLIYRLFEQRLLLDIDFDSTRSEDGFIGEGNVYALHFLGRSDEPVRSASLGNRIFFDPFAESTPEQPGQGEIAGAVSTAWQLRGGELGIDASVRYATSDEQSIVYRGGNREIKLDLLDVNQARRRIYFVPDPGLSESSLVLYRSVASGGERTIEGVRYERLVRGIDFDYDASRGWIYLRRALTEDNYLIAYYEVDGVPVGGVSLGRLAYIDETGNRADFSESAYPDYFVTEGTTSYLALARADALSYWEHRGAYNLGRLEPDGGIRESAVELRFTGSGLVNPAYDALIRTFEIDAQRGLLLFAFEDTVGFYPRPFPGRTPFTATPDPGNPFAPDNPIYGDVVGYDDTDSIHTISVRLLQEADAYEIPDIYLPGSITVTVDGRPLGGSEFTVDDATGMVSIAADNLGPGSEVIIRYRLAGEDARNARVRTQIDARYVGKRSNLDSSLVSEIPVEGPAAPDVATIRDLSLTSRSSVQTEYFAESERVDLDVRAEVAGTVSRPGLAGLARIASMNPAAPRTVDLTEAVWTLASPSGLLPALATTVPLDDRGEIRYANYRDAGPFGTTLRTLGWDTSGNPQFAYREKAGPYNAADAPDTSNQASLAVDYEFPTGTTNPYVTIATALSGNLDSFASLRFDVKGVGIESAPVRVYVEILSDYQEDLDGDDEIDAELSPSSTGLQITPVGGTVTRIGTDPWGEPDGRIATEDQDNDGRLEPVGAYALDAETGVVLGAGAHDYATELQPGTSAWSTVRLDLAGAIGTDVLDRARTLRITLVPQADDARGIVLVHGMRFEGPAAANRSPATLTSETLAADVSAELAASPLADAFPSEYNELRGPSRYREDQAEVEQALRLSLVPTLAAGERAYVATAVPAGTLSRYARATFFVYRPSSQAAPPALELDLRVSDGANSALIGALPVSELTAGWNRLDLQFADAGALLLNGVPRGSVTRIGDGRQYANSVELGFVAVGADVTTGFTIWTDEWYVADAGWDLAGSAAADVRFSWDHTIELETGFPLLRGGEFSARYGLDASQSGLNHEAAAATTIEVLRAARASAAWDHRGAIGVNADAQRSLVVGYRYAPDSIWSPYVEHEFVRRTERTVERGSTEERDRAAIALELGMESDDGLSLDISGSREIGSREFVAESASVSSTVDDAAALAIGGLPAGLEISSAYRHRFAGETRTEPAAGAPGEYVRLAGSFGTSPAALLTDAALVSRQYEGRIASAIATDRVVSAKLAASAAYHETGSSILTEPGTLAEALSLSVQLPIAAGDWTVTPSLARDLRATFPVFRAGTSAQPYSEPALALLASPSVFFAPGADQARTEAVQVLDALAAAGAGVAVVDSETEISFRYAGDQDLVPGRGGLTLATTFRGSGPVYGMVERQKLSLGKTVTLPRTARVTLIAADGSLEHEADLLLDTRKVAGSASVYYSTTSADGSSLSLSQSSTLTRTWQDSRDPLLTLFTREPSREEPAPPAPGEWRWDLNATSVYRWSTARGPTRASVLASELGLEAEPLAVRNEERLTVSSSHAIPDEPSPSPQTTKPLQVTLEHRSEIDQTENLSIAVGLTAQGGMEQTRSGSTVSRTAAFGMQGSVSLVIRY